MYPVEKKTGYEAFTVAIELFVAVVTLSAILLLWLLLMGINLRQGRRVVLGRVPRH